ncbi:MAG: protein kinase [Polyangiaceae bacterium]|nr:protein kinase [Polyangiaceae bacterium]MCW5788939.1 protein kinase [Polyangiaceae bacterium]
MTAPTPHTEPELVGRYAIYQEIAAGGMATVHLGRLVGEGGFSRTVAIKRLHPQFARDADFVDMFLDEARIAARIRHPNVVSTLDVVANDGALLLVMDYVHGESLSKLLRLASQAQEYVPLDVCLGIVSQALLGLHAAHEAQSERGEPLGIVHRDISPQNIMVGTGGVAQVLDFGVAKAAMRASTTREGQVKGKIAYMAPEQLASGDIDRRVDVFAAGVVLWESLTGKRLFAGQDLAETLGRITQAPVAPPSSLRPEVPPEVDAIVLKALAKTPGERFASALEFATTIEATGRVGSALTIGSWVQRIAAQGLSERSLQVSEVESRSTIVPRGIVPRAEVSVAEVPSAVTEAPARPSRSWPLIAALTTATLLAVTLAVGALWVLRAKEERTAAEPPPDPRVSAQTGATGPAEPTAAAEPTQPTTAGPIEAAEPAEPAEAAEPTQAPTPQATKPSAPPSTKAAPAAQPKAAPKPKPAPAAVANCDPPYSIDDKGIKRIKPGCL